MTDAATTSIVVRDRCGPHCVAIEEGEALLAELIQLLRLVALVRLDFTGVETLASSFLNAALGRLYGEFPFDFVDNHVELAGLDEADLALAELVVSHAKDYYRKRDPERARDDKIVSDTVEGRPWQSRKN